MNRDLEDALARVGWDALYERHVPSLGAETTRGERVACSPFPFSDDRHASFSVNVRSGLWQDWHSAPLTGMQGGNYVQFCALMRARVGPDGRPAPDFSAAERELRVELGLSRPVDPAWLAACQAALAHSDSPGHRAWLGRKPWEPAALRALGVGWDEARGRLVIPTHAPDGSVANARLYRPGAHPKVLWAAVGLGDNYLFPARAREEAWVVLVEGEPDAITLRCLGYNGASGTMGSGNPVPPGRWWAGKRVFVWMDDDGPGREAEEHAVRLLVDGAAEVRVVRWPDWEGKPGNADPSDYVLHLLSQRYDVPQVQREVSRLLSESRLATSERTAWDAPPVRMPFGTVLTAANAGVRVEFVATTLGQSSKVFSLVTRAGVTCPAHGHPWCRTCPMNQQHHGDATVHLDPRSPLSLKLIRVPEERRDAAVLASMHVPARCPEPRLNVQQSADMRVAMLGTTMAEAASGAASEVDRRKHEAVVIVPSGAALDDNADYRMEGFVYPLPSSQEQVLLVDRFARVASRHDSFDPTPEALAALGSFRPKSDVLTSLGEVALDFGAAHTLIRGRPDLHALYRSVWHSVLAFEFGGAVHRRGWLEAVVVGDTRTGKSAAFKAMAAVFGTGTLVDCKMQSTAGMLGSVEQSLTTGERFVVAGLLPQHDGAGPVCLDEFTAPKGDRLSLVDVMSSVRAEGKVVISKAASATFLARVRLVLLANPGVGRLMRDIGGFGVEVLPRLIPQPEDIARFDLAMCTTQDDVPHHVINVATPPARPSWPAEAHRALLQWTWSRRPEQVVWAAGAEAAVLATAESMCAFYSARVPLVEPADQRMRVAKLAVSVAAQCYSTDDGERLVVGPEHVHAAGALYAMWYNKASFGYDAFSRAQEEESRIRDEAEVGRLLDRILQPSPAMYARRVVRLVDFNDRVLMTVTPMPWMEVRPAMQVLMHQRCIRQVDGRMDVYELTPAFIRFLEEYARRKEARG